MFFFQTLIVHFKGPDLRVERVRISQLAMPVTEYSLSIVELFRSVNIKIKVLCEVG